MMASLGLGLRNLGIGPQDKAFSILSKLTEHCAIVTHQQFIRTSFSDCLVHLPGQALSISVTVASVNKESTK